MNVQTLRAEKLWRCLATLWLIGVLGALLAPPVQAVENQPPPPYAYHPNHVLVGFEPGTTAMQRSALHGLLGAQVLNTLDWLDLDVVLLPEGLDPLEAAARYETQPGVRYAHPNWVARLSDHRPNTPNDLFFHALWGLDNYGQLRDESVEDADIDAPEGWAAAFPNGDIQSSGGTRVGILDTGIDPSHVDLLFKTKTCASAITAIGLVIQGVCHDDNLHGTHVAGTIGAIVNNGVGVAGVAPNAEFAVFKALNAAGTGFYADVIAGIQWLRTRGGAKIINMSIGGPKARALDQELAKAYSNGTLLIAAAGNDGDSTPNYPAHHRDVVSVAATDDKDKHASFSNCNADVEIAAPGVDIWSTIPGNLYARLSGTSMAAPHVSGVAAMIWWKHSSLSASEVRKQLIDNADYLGQPARIECSGHGRVNLQRALN